MSIEMTASLFRSYVNKEKPVRRVSRRKDEEDCGTRNVDTGVDVGVCRRFVVSLKLCCTRAGHASSNRALLYFKDTAHYILLVELCERDSKNIRGW